MIQPGFETKVKIQEVIESQLPEFILDESPKTAEFLKQYYISQEFQGGTIDIAENLDQYVKLDNLTPEVVIGETSLVEDISEDTTNIKIHNIKGYPKQYGLLKIDDEIITYTGITTTTIDGKSIGILEGCIRGFSGIATYSKDSSHGDLVFTTSKQVSHKKDTKVKNLSTLFLQEFYKKIKYSLTPGLENYNFTPDLDISNFIKSARSFYQAKGTTESFRILFNVLYGVNPTIVNLEDYLIKPSSAEFIRREILLTEFISGENPFLLRGQTIRKSTDLTTQASVSAIEILNRKGKTYYKLSLFTGYGDNGAIDGVFTIPGKTKIVEKVLVGSSVITVDSTIGFGKFGSLVCNGKTISYTDKTINQFLGCDDGSGNGITTVIEVASDIRSDEVIFGFENGNITKKVELRITGVINEFVAKNDIYSGVEGEKIYVKNLGEKITNPESNSSFKQIFANSLIYNTSVRYEVSEISGSVFSVDTKIDKSSLREGDLVQILNRNTNNVAFDNVIVKSINKSSNQIILDNLIGFFPSNDLSYDIRRKLKKASSEFVPLSYGNNTIFSDVQNFYNENDEYFYIASNSLPSYPITKLKFEASIPEASETYIQGFNLSTLKYSIISFEQNVPFVTGDSIYYRASSSSNPINGLESGQRYYVEVLDNPNQIRLYVSRAFIFYQNYLEFSPLDGVSGSHIFTLFEQSDKELQPQKLLRKFPAKPNIFSGTKQETIPGSIGILINGVEIINYKSSNKIYYGPLETVSVVSSGSNYDVVNPPVIEVSTETGSGALVQPVVRGKITEVIVDPQDFDINNVLSVTIEGGNNVATKLEPILEKEFREVFFNGKLITESGGGVDTSDDTLTFITNHYFTNGQAIIYDNNENEPLGIGTFKSSNADQNLFLIPGSVYFSENVNNRTIKLFGTYNDYSNGINTVGFTTINTQGIHKFRVFDGKTTLKRVEIVDEGGDFENRILRIKSFNVNSILNSINFTKHGFNDGDLVVYETTGSPIVGLTTNNKYYVLKRDDNSFSLADSGGDGSDKTDYFNKDYVKILSHNDDDASYYHVFKYPDIKVSLNVEYSSTVGIITVTPIIKGSIIDAYLYEKGSDYGSEILNLHKKPLINVKTGQNAQIKPIISNGRILNFELQSSGSGYVSEPDLIVEGSGIGAKLRAVVNNGGIVGVVIINPGINYNSNNTTIKIQPRGLGVLFDSQIRTLSINNFNRNGVEILNSNKDDLKYGWIGYSTSFARSIFNDVGGQHSPIIGWAYDGNPIYGPYGFSDPEDSDSSIKNLHSGYELNPSNVENRPSSFPGGFFVEDYTFVGNSDLDQFNGRYCRTPQFPDGIYAYFATIESDSSSGLYSPSFPYFIGNNYRSSFIEDNKYISQEFDFNNSSLIRNTYPYNVLEEFSGSDSLIESNELVNQFSTIESIKSGNITFVEVKESGEDYSIGDIAVFNNDGTGGGGLSAYVNELTGKEIISLQTNITNYTNSLLVKDSNETILVGIGSTHNLKTNDKISIINLSSDIPFLSRSYTIQVPSATTYIYQDVAPNTNPGIATDIYVSSIPEGITVGSQLGIGTEIVSVLNVFEQSKVLRIKRGISGTAHTISDSVDLIPDTFKLNIKINDFNSKINHKVFFNSHQSVGIGTTVGTSNSLLYAVGENINQISVPTQSIYLPNHPFKTNQRVTIKKSSSASPIQVCNTSNPSEISFYLMDVSDEDDVYVINKAKDYIGITTSVGLTTNTGGLFFRDNGSNSYEYCIESNFDQITCDIRKINTLVSVSTSHNLEENDRITLNVIPKQDVGITTDIPLSLSYNSSYGKLLVNSLGLNTTGISTTENKITVLSHGFKTGDKVFYSSSDGVASGLTTGGYFVYKINDDDIKLSERYSDLFLSTPNFVDIVSIGGTTQKLSLINPPITVIKNNNLVFNLNDSSLNGYNLKLFYDREFNNEFVSTGTTNTFLISGVGTPGITPSAYFKLEYSDSLPSKLFYCLEKSGSISTTDVDVKNYSEIIFEDSSYNGNYNVFSSNESSFTITLDDIPEQLYYDSKLVKSFDYSTNSLNVKGGVKKVGIAFSGANYKELPIFQKFESESGKGAFLVPYSKDVGKLDRVRILDPGFEYASDKTLRPEAFVSPFISLTKVQKVKNITVDYGGDRYTSKPDLVLVNTITREVVDNGILNSIISSSAMTDVQIILSPEGLDANEYQLFTTNNSNGVPIDTVLPSANSGIITCFLTTPVLGFDQPPFSIGDKIFVEGIQKSYTTGDGYNSSDYGYQFFEIINFVNTNPARLEYALPSGKSNPGMAHTNQSSYASVIKENFYPKFTIEKEFARFSLNEKVLVFDPVSSLFVETDLIISDFNKEYLKIYGAYELKIGDKIRGKSSGSLATIRELSNNKAFFNIGYSLKRDLGWITDTGFLNQDYQVLPNNDYYQTLAYTIKSPIDYETFKTPVNSLVHTTGLKNFGDLGITSSAKTSIGSSSIAFTNVVDLITQERVDTINNVDLVKDFNTFENKSKFVFLRSKRLSPYVQCLTNRALNIDDISTLFSNKENVTTQHLDILTFTSREDYSRFLIQILDPASLDRQVTELFVVKDGKNAFTFQKQSLSILSGLSNQTAEGGSLGLVEAFLDNNTRTTTLRFYPNDPLNVDYDVKVLKIKTDITSSGVGTYRLGSVNLIGFNTSTTGISSITPIVKVGVSSLSSLFANIQIVDTVTQEKTFAELYLNHDGTNTYLSQYFLDTDEANGNFSGDFIGSFTSEIKSGILYLNFNSYKDKINTIDIRSEIIGFASTVGGSEHYTFRSVGQLEESARSARLETVYNKLTGISTVISVDKNLFTTIKSYIRIESPTGSETPYESTLHQVLLIHNQSEIHVTQYANLSLRNPNGIGTFGGVYEGSNVVLKFYPDSQYNSIPLSIQSYNEIIYDYIDIGNEPLDLVYGTLRQSVLLGQYNAINGSRINKTSFILKSDGVPIFMKEFDPNNSSILNSSTGLIRVPNHFFSNAERLIYRPYSPFLGVSPVALGIGATLNSSGIVTTTLPSEVYAIKIDNDTIKLATRRDYALSGVGVTFTSLGVGNAHQLEMYKKLEKGLISIDGVIQYPLAYTPIVQTLQGNLGGGGQLGVGVSYIALSGISSIYPEDIVRIDDEYVKVISVGVGTTASGPINGIGTVSMILVDRGFVGTSQTVHNDSSSARVYSGTYNIVGKNIHFVSPPRGDVTRARNQSNLLDPRSTFNGRVFLKSDYSNSRVFDDISRTFDGISQHYQMTVQGINTVGIDTGSGILLINDVFQTPTSPTNLNNNYSFTEVSGISSVVFSGITSSNGSVITSPFDINQNQLPRGGLIVSLGSTSGIGYAPLVGAAVTAIVGAGGSIKAVGITTLDVYGSGYRGNVSVGITEVGHTGTAASIIATVGAGGSLSFQVITGGTGYTDPTIFVRNPSYSNLPVTGVFRRGIGQTSETGTGLLLNVEIGSSQTDLRPISGRNADAATLINFNKQLIAEVAVKRMLAAYPGFSVPGGNQNCISDVISVLDCVIYNLKYGGNSSVYDAAKIYIDNAYLAGEEQQSIYTFMQARDMAIQAMRNETITIGGYSTISQYFDNTVEGDISGLPGVYNPGDCADVASAIGSFVGIVTFAIRDNTISATRTGVSTSFFEVTKFEIVRTGYGFRLGDVFKPVGLVTDRRIATPIQDFELTVIDTFTDNFSYWQFGELDYIDSVQSFQNGSRTRFPLYYQGNPISFEKNYENPDSILIDLASILVILVNGVIQEPDKNYIFDGGTSFRFTTPPRVEDKVSIFFYRGSRTVDSITISNVPESIKVGDTIKIDKNNSIPITIEQDSRTVHRVAFSDTLETNVYSGEGIDEDNFKPLSWSKQKSDKTIDGEYVSKSRDSIESLVFPTAKIIKNFISTSTELFVDNADFFKYEANSSPFEEIENLGAIIINDKQPVAAALTAVVSAAGTIQSLSIVDSGSGYSGSSVVIRIASPPVSSGSSTASATASVVNGSLTDPLVINPGSGYSVTSQPKVISPFPSFDVENIKIIQNVEGFSGIVTGIGTTSGTSSNPLALRFFLKTDEVSFVGLNEGYPIYIFNTNVGHGITSIDTSNSSIVGIGTTCLDNVYYIHSIVSYGDIAEVVTNVQSNSRITGITTSGTEKIGEFSWGRFSNFERGNYPISIAVTGYTANNGLSTFPSVQRRGYGIRENGGLKKKLLSS